MPFCKALHMTNVILLEPLVYKSFTDLTYNHLFNSFLYNKFRKHFIRDGEETRHVHIAFPEPGP